MFYKVNGSAGYGKTHSLVEKAIELEKANTCFLIITPTNKAAMVLNSRLTAAGLKARAKTLHSTLYTWERGDVKSTKEVRYIDPDTGKFAVDANQNPKTRTETEYYWVKTINSALRGSVVIVDEASMVDAGVWHDLDNCGLFPEIWTYGDEKQLPPVERFKDIQKEHQPYFHFWHKMTATQTLTVNYRQAGTLKDFVETCEQQIFARRQPGIPTPLEIGDNVALSQYDIDDETMLTMLNDVDMIITPYNKVRHLCNIIIRRHRAILAGTEFNPLPIAGDKIILTQSVKETLWNVKVVKIAKNTTATITRVVDIDTTLGLIIVDLIDENGEVHCNVILSLSAITGATYPKFDKPTFEYAYAITVHKSQGAQWANVLYLDSEFPNDLDKMRYVAVTRASKRLWIVTDITNVTEAANASKSSVLVRVFQGL